MIGIIACVVGLYIGTYARPACSQVQSWEVSPQNWRNSEQNWDNNPQKWENSPQNWKNNYNNYNSKDGVYDNIGNRIGYETMSPSGVKNYYDNNGNREGYNPYGRWHD